VVLPASHRVSRAPWYSGSARKEATPCRLPGSHRLWPTVPGRSPMPSLAHSSTAVYRGPAPPATPAVQRIHALADSRFGLLPVRSSLLRESRLLSVPPGTEIFHFPGLASPAYGFSKGCGSITCRGLPHSGISGSQPVSGSPELLAAYYALPRLRAPRHPPYALLRLTIICQRTCCFRIQLSKSCCRKDGTSQPDSCEVELTDASCGGEYRIRTGDLRLARAALSQLS
jgi:hypothetical protein